MELMLLDTSFLVDLERELRRNKQGPAKGFLERNPELPLSISFTVAGELSCGVSLEKESVWLAYIAPFQVLESNREVSWNYGRLYRALKKQGEMIGSNDLWIAATALAYEATVLTGNLKEFSKIPNGPKSRSYS